MLDHTGPTPVFVTPSFPSFPALFQPFQLQAPSPSTAARPDERAASASCRDPRRPSPVGWGPWHLVLGREKLRVSARPDPGACRWRCASWTRVRPPRQYWASGRVGDQHGYGWEPHLDSSPPLVFCRPNRVGRQSTPSGVTGSVPSTPPSQVTTSRPAHPSPQIGSGTTAAITELPRHTPGLSRQPQVTGTTMYGRRIASE